MRQHDGGAGQQGGQHTQTGGLESAAKAVGQPVAEVGEEVGQYTQRRPEIRVGHLPVFRCIDPSEEQEQIRVRAERAASQPECQKRQQPQQRSRSQ